MVSIENHIGKITVSEKYLKELVKHTVSGCFGVADVYSTGAFNNTVASLTAGIICKKHDGVLIRTNKEGGLIIDLHIKVTFGTNITAAVKSITHKVSFTVEEAIGTAVSQVNVFVDEMIH
ncbi:MAG: Asp23/Gls24 family envelope stress response protein [Ruminococcus sp.]|nr:Asp23/Gls24 family envelope stress response protein [Ruminococcus sp.]